MSVISHSVSDGGQSFVRRTFLSEARCVRRRLLATDASPPPPRRHALSLTLSALAIFGSGYIVGAILPPKNRFYRIAFPHEAPESPATDSPEGIRQTAAVEAQLQNLALVSQLRAEGDKWDETRPYLHYPAEKLRHNLLAGTLKGPGRLAVPPLVFSTHDDTESIIFVHIGRSLCGHDGVVHGGLLATLLDEGVARPAICALPQKLGVTANLTVNYRAPAMADQFVVMKTRLIKQEGRKAWVEGRIETLEGELVAEATALYIQPKLAGFLANSSVSERMGMKSAKHPANR